MIDFDAYFRRIAYTGPRVPSLDALTTICAAHTATIAFENMDALLGRAPLLAPAALQAKLVDQRRGGYCYEQNALLRLVLLELGMRVTSLAARVVWMAPPDAPLRARSHMLLQVALPALPHESFIADVGFGGHLLGAPLRFVPDLVQRTPGGTERIVQDGETFALEAELPAGWTRVYCFTLDPHTPVDYEPLNWFTATHPGSIFRHNLRVERLAPSGRATLLNDKLTLRPADGTARTQRIESADELAEVIDTIFDLALPVSPGALFDRIPKGLETAYLPQTG
ncbi:MAG: arylamine N-acetyltransferase [Rhizobiales bacterium]|nr:arylamine N-acetyltransferase [Rhizobacter sp.]